MSKQKERGEVVIESKVFRKEEMRLWRKKKDLEKEKGQRNIEEKKEKYTGDALEIV